MLLLSKRISLKPVQPFPRSGAPAFVKTARRWSSSGSATGDGTDLPMIRRCSPRGPGERRNDYFQGGGLSFLLCAFTSCFVSNKNLLSGNNKLKCAGSIVSIGSSLFIQVEIREDLSISVQS